jgi:hypothetical protein
MFGLRIMGLLMRMDGEFSFVAVVADARIIGL